MTQYSKGHRVWWRLPQEFIPRLAFRVYVKAKVTQVRPEGRYVIRYHAGLKLEETKHRFQTVSERDIFPRTEKEPTDVSDA